MFVNTIKYKQLKIDKMEYMHKIDLMLVTKILATFMFRCMSKK